MFKGLRFCIVLSVALLGLQGCVSKRAYSRLIFENRSDSTLSVIVAYPGSEVSIAPSAKKVLGHAFGITVSIDGKPVARYDGLSPWSAPTKFISTWHMPLTVYYDLLVVWGPDGKLYLAEPGSRYLYPYSE
jgi:hypothetical protein